MKTWKLVSGIISIILFLLVMFQSCAAGISNTLEANGELSGSAGLIVSIMMLAGGIVSIATRKGGGRREHCLNRTVRDCCVGRVHNGGKLC